MPCATGRRARRLPADDESVDRCRWRRAGRRRPRAVLTFRDYGVTWDEDVHNWYGNFVLDYYLSLFGDKTRAALAGPL